MATTADFKNGLCFIYNADIYKIVQFQHVKPGKGPAFVRTKLKNLKNGKIIENTFNSGVNIELANVERRPYSFLYNDEMGFHFMHQESFEQISIEESLIESADLLKEGQYVEITVDADSETPMSVDLPPFVDLKVTYTEPGLRGDTSSATATKPATVETGAKIQVPLFVNQDEIIRIDTRERKYYERVR